MASSVEFLDQLEVNIDTRAVLRIQGCGGNRKPRAGVGEIVTRQIEAARQLVRPRAIYREVEVLGMEEDAVRLEDDLVLHTGKRIAGWWHGSQSLAICVCTIGGALEERIMALSSNGEHAAALNLDIAGSVALGSVADQVRRLMCEKASSLGLKVGPTLNPGYREWPLTDQRLIFTIMPAETIGVHLNDQFMMVPKKSLSSCAGLGISKALESFNRCSHCGLPDCPYRIPDKREPTE